MSNKPDLNSAGSFLGRFVGERVQNLFAYVLLVGAVSIPVTVIGLASVLKRGHATSFPSTDPRVGWVDNPDTRGTLNIVWTCIWTIFTCVYVSVHIGIPDKTKSGNFIWRFFTNPHLRKIYWLLFNIFAPELMVFVALCERWSAKDGVTFMRRHGVKGWKMEHAFFADMGGFKLRDGQVFRSGREFYEWFITNRSRVELDEDTLKDIKQDIIDRSKRNGVLKFFTCAQATWLLIETVARFAEHQPVSELEVTTCAYIICAIVTYGCWLAKPYGVDRQITLPCDDGNAKQDEKQDEKRQSAAEVGQNIFLASAAELPTALFPKAPFTPFNRAYNNPDRAILICCHSTCLVGLFVSAMHAIPFWNALFVNTEGQIIWRICSVAQISLSVVFAFIASVEKQPERNTSGLFLWVLLLFMALVYCVSRIMLFALIWLSFGSQPVGVYRDVNWPFRALPHWE